MLHTRAVAHTHVVYCTRMLCAARTHCAMRAWYAARTRCATRTRCAIRTCCATHARHAHAVIRAHAVLRAHAVSLTLSDRQANRQTQTQLTCLSASLGLILVCECLYTYMQDTLRIRCTLRSRISTRPLDAWCIHQVVPERTWRAARTRCATCTRCATQTRAVLHAHAVLHVHDVSLTLNLLPLGQARPGRKGWEDIW